MPGQKSVGNSKVTVREGSTVKYKNGKARHNITKYRKGQDQGEQAGGLVSGYLADYMSDLTAN